MSHKLHYGPRFRNKMVIEGPNLTHQIGQRDPFGMLFRYEKYVAAMKSRNQSVPSYKEFLAQHPKHAMSKEKKREVQIKKAVRHSQTARAKKVKVTLATLDKSTTNN